MVPLFLIDTTLRRQKPCGKKSSRKGKLSWEDRPASAKVSAESVRNSCKPLRP